MNLLSTFQSILSQLHFFKQPNRNISHVLISAVKLWIRSLWIIINPLSWMFSVSCRSCWLWVLTMCWWCIDDILTMYWRCIDDVLTMYWRYIDDVLTMCPHRSSSWQFPAEGADPGSDLLPALRRGAVWRLVRRHAVRQPPAAQPLPDIRESELSITSGVFD